MSAWRGGADEDDRAAEAAKTKVSENWLRMHYAGVLGLLSECFVYVPEEVREQIEAAFVDAASTGNFKYSRIFNRLEIEVV